MAALRTWTGGGADAPASTPENWFAAAVPVNGDHLRLAVTIGGNFTLGAGAALQVNGCGYSGGPNSTYGYANRVDGC